MSQIRINKYLASIGVASRRKIDEITTSGRITINGKLAKLGDKVDPETDRIVVDKKIIPPSPSTQVYFALNKPKYVLSSVSDNRGRDVVTNYVPKNQRIFPVGRLDYESTGLIILTNDGDLALKLTHPRYHLPKVYLVTILGRVSPQKLEDLRQDNHVKIEISQHLPNKTVLKFTLYTGKKRQIRLLCASNHLFILELYRISIGPIQIGNLAPGEFRELNPMELKSIRL
jgi:pseudouridine synthase